MKDDIQDSIDIHADLPRVWELVSEPGWWINSGTLGGHRIHRDGSECVVVDESLGSFEVGIVELDEPHRAVFTWQPSGEQVPRTTVEFRLVETEPGTVRVQVCETGFASMSPEQHARHHRANESGWHAELGLAAATLTGGARVAGA
ncbi:MAG: SRPBCC domain-containing protein [Nocardioidaceae bacterium]|nr:SRPBCC domain-containing protein [Nocardioidaceae bacterium]